MKIQRLLFVLISIGILFTSCEEPPEKTNEKIDKTVEGTKDIIDVLGNKAKELVSDKELQSQLKDILNDVKLESKELEQILKEKGDDLKEKLEELKDDPKFKEKLKDLGDDADEILKKLEELGNELKKKE